MSRFDPKRLHPVHNGDSGSHKESVLLFWRPFKAKAEEIIDEVGRDIRVISVRGDRWRKGEQLAAEGEERKRIARSLARLLADATEEYLGAKSYCEAMDMPTKRYRPSVAKKPMKYPKGYDYTAYQSAEETVRQYVDMLALFPKRKAGNPTKTRSGDLLELGPLVPVYRLAREWWIETTKGRFTPSFAGGDDVTVEGSEYDDADDTNESHRGSDYNNADSRFLLMVLKCVEPRCTAAHALQVDDQVRKKRFRRN